MKMYFHQAMFFYLFLGALALPIYNSERGEFEQDKFDETNVKNCDNCKLIRKERVVGGNPSDPNQYPWMAALMITHSDRPFCGGSIISNRFILTAAHCVQSKLPSSIVARVGAHEFNKELDNYSRDYQIEKYHIHRDYNPSTFDNDIALLQLKAVINFTKVIQPIKITTDENADFSDQLATVAGWGRESDGGVTSNVLRHVELRVLDTKKCNEIYRKSMSTVVDESKMFCAFDANGEKDSCTGDSGGPLMVFDQDSKWMLIGLVSWGIGCADPKYPGVYTRVNKYLQWIEKCKQDI